ncbi:MAG: queuosine precursor transporter [Firmicutes bacterium]|nr:queuosine precursor transporter [Bacillota bacterium]
MEIKKVKATVLYSVLYISLILFSNLGSLRVILLAGLSLDGGTLLYPFTFTMRDVLHKKCGGEIARFVILLSAAINLLMFAFAALVGALPADMAVGAQTEYALVLAPGFRIVIASILAATLAELLDTRIYSLVRDRFGDRHQWLRVLFSNLVSVPLDSAVFVLAAFAGRYSAAALWGIFIGNIVVKYVVSLLSLGSIYLVKEDRA